MNKIKQWAYNKFAEEDKKAKADEANTVTPVAATPVGANQEDTQIKKGIPAKRKKRLIIWLIILAIVGTILGVSLYFGLRPTEENMGTFTDVKVGSKPNTIEVSDNSRSLIIDTGSNASYSYRLANDTYVIYADIINSNLPLKLTAYYFPDVSGDLYLNGLKIVYTPPFPPPTPPTPPGLTDEQIAANKKAEENYTFIRTWVTSVQNKWQFEPSPFPWFSLVSILLPIILFGALFFFYFRMAKMQGGGNEGIFSMGKSGAQLAKSLVKFSDVAGIKEEKEELMEIVDYLRHPQKYAVMGARTPKGVILYGPPGTGKTLLAKAVAGEANVTFLQISGSQFEDMLVGVGAKRVRDLFSKARKAAPAIIFIDEIDSVASKRGKNEFGGGLADQTINQLLAEMDGFNTTTGIVVIAATNRLDVLDDAILRPGRFDRHIQVTLPDIKEREEILKIHARNKNISQKVSLYDIARRTPGFSGAQLENVLNEATLLAVREDKTTIGVIEIDEAIDRVIAGPAKKSKVVTERERKLIAYHEAGHALVGLFTPGSEVVQKITIIPRGSAAGYTMQTPEDQEKNIQSKEDLLSMIRMTLGGRASEEIVYGPEAITTGASNDLYKITNVARAMVMQLGMTKAGMTQFFPSEGYINPYQQQKLFSDDKAREIDAEVEKIIQTEYAKAKDIIKKNRKELDLIVHTLLILETIMKDEIDYIHKHKKLPIQVIEREKEIEKELKSKDAKKDTTSKKKDTSDNNKDDSPKDKKPN